MSADLRLGRWQDVLADVPDGAVRLLLTSPPYDNARTYEGTNEPVDFGELARFALRVLCPGGTLAMVLDGPIVDGEQSITPYRVLVEWAAMEGWKFRQFLAYGRQGAPGKFPTCYRKDHEPCLLFVRDGGAMVNEVSRIAERVYVPPGKVATRRRTGADIIAKKPAANQGEEGPKYRGSVWWYGTINPQTDDGATSGHPATFAEAFALDAVTVWSNPGDLVCDPFAGSGTVGRACIDTGRRFVGAERVQKYHANALLRLAQTSIFERTAPPGAGDLPSAHAGIPGLPPREAIPATLAERGRVEGSTGGGR